MGRWRTVLFAMNESAVYKYTVLYIKITIGGLHRCYKTHAVAVLGCGTDSTILGHVSSPPPTFVAT